MHVTLHCHIKYKSCTLYIDMYTFINCIIIHFVYIHSIFVDLSCIQTFYLCCWSLILLIQYIYINVCLSLLVYITVLSTLYIHLFSFVVLVVGCYVESWKSAHAWPMKLIMILISYDSDLSIVFR